MDQKINDTKLLICSCLSINLRFSSRFPKLTKTSNKDLSLVSVGLVGLVTTSYARDLQFIQTLLWSLQFVIQVNLNHDTSTIQFYSKKFNLPNLTSLNMKKIYSSNTAKNRTLQIFQKTCLCLVSNKTLALYHFYSAKYCIFKALGKQMSSARGWMIFSR